MNYNNTNYDSKYTSNVFNYPWYLSTWFIFLLSILSFLIVPAVIAVLLVIKRNEYEDKLFEYLRELEFQRDEVQRVYEERNYILSSAKEESEQKVREAEIKSSEMISNAESQSYSILVKAEEERTRLIESLKQHENRINERENMILKKGQESGEVVEDILRKLNLFSNEIDKYRNIVKTEYLKNDTKINSKNYEPTIKKRDFKEDKKAEDIDINKTENADESDYIFNTLKIKIPDEYLD